MSRDRHGPQINLYLAQYKNGVVNQVSVAYSIPAAATLFAGGRASHRCQTLFRARTLYSFYPLTPLSPTRSSLWPRAIARGSDDGRKWRYGRRDAIRTGMEVVKCVSCFFIHTSFSHTIQPRTLLDHHIPRTHSCLGRPICHCAHVRVELSFEI